MPPLVVRDAFGVQAPTRPATLAAFLFLSPACFVASLFLDFGSAWQMAFQNESSEGLCGNPKLFRNQFPELMLMKLRSVWIVQVSLYSVVPSPCFASTGFRLHLFLVEPITDFPPRLLVAFFRKPYLEVQRVLRYGRFLPICPVPRPA
jgi:hypothetical protein